jgi:hypothetical protein
MKNLFAFVSYDDYVVLRHVKFSTKLVMGWILIFIKQNFRTKFGKRISFYGELDCGNVKEMGVILHINLQDRLFLI